VVGAAATNVSGWPLRIASGDGNANEVGGAVVLPGRSCMTLIAGRVVRGRVDDDWAASSTSSRCWMLSADEETVDGGNVMLGAAAAVYTTEQNTSN